MLATKRDKVAHHFSFPVLKLISPQEHDFKHSLVVVLANLRENESTLELVVLIRPTPDLGVDLSERKDAQRSIA